MKISIITSFVFLTYFSLAQNMQVHSVYFTKNSTAILDTSLSTFNKWLEMMRDSSYKVDELHIFSDTNGTVAHNQNLSIQREELIFGYLRKFNIPYSQSKIFGEKYQASRYQITEYEKWRRIDLYYTIPELKKVIPPVVIVDTIKKVEEVIIPKVDSVKPKSKFYIDEFNPIVLNIGFYEGKSKLLSLSYRELDELEKFMKENPNVKVVIRGHVCCGNKMSLSKKRAKRVYQEMTYRGIAKERMTYKGMSNSDPLVFPELSDNDRQKNRRVDVIFSL